MTNPDKAQLPPLVRVLAEWEDANGSLAGILPEEWSALWSSVTDAAAEQSPRQLRTALSTVPAAAPQGWKLVPLEPTEAMNKAASGYGYPWNVWRAMLVASPTPPAAAEGALTDEQCDTAIRASGLWTLAMTVPQNLAMLRGLCRAALSTAPAHEARLPHPGSPEASAMIDSVLAEYNWPSNAKNAARAGYVAASRMLTPTPAVAPSEARRLADAIDPLTRKHAPDNLTIGCAAKLLSALATPTEAPSALGASAGADRAVGPSDPSRDASRPSASIPSAGERDQ
jgi:hypothetical protein